MTTVNCPSLHARPRHRHGFLRTALALLALTLLSAACGGELSPEERTRIALEAASREAARAYQLLLDNDCQAFIDRRRGMDTIGTAPDDSAGRHYKEQLAEACQQYRHRLQDKHGGVTSFTVSNARMDSTLNEAHIFFLLHFGDSTEEEIVVPMVEYKGRWVMK